MEDLPETDKPYKTTPLSVAPGPHFAASLTTLSQLRMEQAKLYRMLYMKNPRLTKQDWERARRVLIDIRDTMLAEAGKITAVQHITNQNTLVVAGGLQRTDELLARFARGAAPRTLEAPVQDGPVLPAEVHAGADGHGTPMAIPEDQGGGGES